MPTPFMHLQIATEILNHPSLSAQTHKLISQHVAPYYFGHVAPDYQAITDVPRLKTHFYTGAPKDNAYPNLWLEYQLHPTDSITVEQAVFIAAYSAHLLLDVAWYHQVLNPFFLENQSWITPQERFLSHNILLAYWDRIAYQSLPDTMGSILNQVSAEGWLPFANTQELNQWRDLLAKQLQPGSTTETTKIYARRLEMEPAQFISCLENETWLENNLFCHVPHAQVPKLLTENIITSVTLVDEYLSTYLLTQV